MRLLFLTAFLLIAASCNARQKYPDFGSIPVTRSMTKDSDQTARYYGLSISELRALSDQGDVAAMGMLNEKLLQESDQASRTEALTLLEKLARDGYIDAQHSLAREYWYGLTAQRDQNLAILWYRQALRGGYQPTAGVWSNSYDNQSANFKEDGTLLQPDVAIQPDQVKALMWTLVSFKMGYPEQLYDLVTRRVGVGLTEQELSRAEALADRCFDSSFVECGWPRR